MVHDANDIKSLLELSEDQVAAEFARREQLGDLGFAAPSPRELASAARAWITTNARRLQDALCGRPEIRRICKDSPGHQDQFHLVLLLAELLGGLAGSHHGTCALAVLVSKMGVEKLCEDCWQRRGDNRDADP